MLVRAIGTRGALFGDLPVGKLFSQLGQVYRKIDGRNARNVDGQLVYVFARHESVRIATVEKYK